MDRVTRTPCANCRAELPDGAKFCGHCGAPIKRDERSAELRQLTVLFCDLVGSTALADTLDPEDLRDVTSAYHTACTEVIARFEGHIAQFLGDGLLVYFGYPVAHEDDARRAVQTALGIIESIELLAARLRTERQIELNVRVGIHTGPVVVGEVGEGMRRENLALGRTPNLAARVQAFAHPGTVVVSEETFRIAHGYFEFEALGTHELKGLAEPVGMHRVLGVSGAESRLDAGRRTGLTTLIGRASELDRLNELWQRVASGGTTSHTILVTGEAGIGKSRLVASLRENVEAQSDTVIECACSPYYQNSALYPVIGSLERSLGFSRETSHADKWAALEDRLERDGMSPEENVVLVAQLLSITPPPGTAPLDLPPQQQRERTLEVLDGWLAAIARRRPTLFIVEDLHWADPTTIEFVNRIAASSATGPLLAVVTFRSDFDAPVHQNPQVSTLSLSRLGSDQTTAMIARVAGNKPLPEEIVRQLVARTEGVPLFVEEVTKAVLELGVLVEREDRYELTGLLPPDLIPATVQGSLLARLDRLGSAKPIAQLAATIGREFRLDVLQAVANLDEAVLREGLARLLGAEFIFQVRGATDVTYLFKHALIQDAAYQSLLKRARLEQHRRIGEALTARFPVVVEQSPEVIAQHFASGGEPDRATSFWLSAGQRALARAANHEAIAHITQAVVQLAQLPVSRERHERELECLIVLTPALQMTQGWATPQVEQTFHRSVELVELLGDTPHRLRVLAHSFTFHVMRGHLSQALALGTQVCELATLSQVPSLQVVGYGNCCVAQLYHGDIATAITSGEAALGLVTAESSQAIVQLAGMRAEAFITCYLSEALWMRGFPEQAVHYSERAVAAAREPRHGPSEEFAVGYQAMFFHLLRDHARIATAVEETLRLSEQHRSAFWHPLAAVYKGWTLSLQGHHDQGVTMMRDGVDQYVAGGHGLSQIHMRTALADALGMAERWDEAFAVLAQTIRLATDTGESFFVPEAYRLRGEFTRRLAAAHRGSERESRLAAAEASIREALEVAKQQGAKSLELRAAMSLCLVRRDMNAVDDEVQELAELLGSFTEGFDTPDLRDARALLSELGG